MRSRTGQPLNAERIVHLMGGIRFKPREAAVLDHRNRSAPRDEESTINTNAL